MTVLILNVRRSASRDVWGPARIFCSLKERSPGFRQNDLSQGLEGFVPFPRDLTGEGGGLIRNQPQNPEILKYLVGIPGAATPAGKSPVKPGL